MADIYCVPQLLCYAPSFVRANVRSATRPDLSLPPVRLAFSRVLNRLCQQIGNSITFVHSVIFPIDNLWFLNNKSTRYVTYSIAQTLDSSIILLRLVAW